MDSTGRIDRASMARLVVMFNEFFKEDRTHGVVGIRRGKGKDTYQIDQSFDKRFN